MTRGWSLRHASPSIASWIMPTTSARAGWNPRHIEGAEHFLFYNLEYVTGKHFLHGQPVTLGVLLMSDLQGNRPEEIRAIADRIGVRYRPVWYTVASARPITESWIARMEAWLSA
jgi:hypothetical protein